MFVVHDISNELLTGDNNQLFLSHLAPAQLTKLIAKLKQPKFMLFSKYKLHQMSCLRALISIINELKVHDEYDKSAIIELYKQIKDKSVSHILNGTLSETKM